MIVSELIAQLQELPQQASIDVKSWGFYYPIVKVEMLSFDKENAVIIINDQS